MNVAEIWSSDEKMKIATGLNLTDASELASDFSNDLGLSSQGRPSKHDERGIFLMVMLYYRHYPTLELLGLMFEVDCSNVKRWVDRGETSLKAVLAKKNFSHLLPPKQGRKLPRPLSSNEKFI